MLIQRDLALLMNNRKILATGLCIGRLCDRRGVSVRAAAYGYHQRSHSLRESVEQDYYWYDTTGD